MIKKTEQFAEKFKAMIGREVTPEEIVEYEKACLLLADTDEKYLGEKNERIEK
jgi:hypothetical protein